MTITENIEEYKEIISQYLEKEALKDFPQNIYDAANYIMLLPGKRLRPILVLLVAEGFNFPLTKALSAAASMEVFHNFTLVHDDIMDKAKLRRGQLTVHEKFGNNKAIVTGDAMMPCAIELLINENEAQALPLIKSFVKMAKEVMEGQQFDMQFEEQEEVTLEEYLNMIRLKTSVLFGCACQIGAILGEASEADQQKLYDFGLNTGLAFQIMDDYLDTFGGKSFGKKIGGDILNNKKTFLLIQALKHANSEQKLAIKILLKEENPEVKISKFQQLFKEIGVDKIVLKQIEEYHNLSLEALNNSCIAEESKQIIANLSNKMLNRTV